ncbi:MAG: DUF4123 domain-containing protein [Candidatus Competibacter sp.]
MAISNPLDVLTRHLFADPGARVYAVLDGAAIPDLPQALREHQMDAVCLYRGELIPELAQVAPYQVILERESPFTAWLLQQGWGWHWGIFALSPAEWRPMREHLCGLVMAYDPDFQPLYFRYYDPRVLRVYLPTCDADELRTLFGPISRLLCEDEEGGLLKFWLAGGQLGSERIDLGSPVRPQSGGPSQDAGKE